MSILTSVESARKATAPIVGIPVDGETPFCLKRSLLVDSLKGLTIIDAGIQMALDGNKYDQRQLVVYATGNRVQAIRRFTPIHRDATLLPQWAWARAQREKRAKPVVKMSGREKQVARLRKQLAKLGKPTVPQHPLLYERDAKYPSDLGGRWAQWKRDAHVRRWIQLQARQCKAGKFNTGKLYQVLAERGLQVRKWSDLRTYDKDRCENLYGYLAILWMYCGLATKPSYWFDANDTEYEGAKHYRGWLEHLHEYKELEAIIAGIQEM